MHLFSRQSLGHYLRVKLAEIEESLRCEVGTVEGSDVEYLVTLEQRFSIEPLKILWEKATKSSREKMVHYEDLPRHYGGLPGKKYPKQVVIVTVPFEGEPDLLEFQPSNFVMWTHEAEVTGQQFSIEFLNISGESEPVKQWFDYAKRNIDELARNSRREVEHFNKKEIRQRTSEALDRRKQELAKQAKALDAIDLPIGGTPAPTHAPITKRKIVFSTVPAAAGEPPSASVDDAQFGSIVQVLYDIGVGAERHPSTYSGKDEEGLRDLFLLQLGTHFLSATGESFNKQGKTDILLRHQNTNLFVAECKFWKGQKLFLDAIDQLLRYLTWRDSKAALIVFVENRELGPVLDQIDGAAASHPRFVRSRPRPKPGWFEVDFSLSGGGVVRLAVLLFYFPPV